MSQETVLTEFRTRRNREREKCLKKYGVDGQLPGGDPSRDVFDYATNESVGLIRYSDMMEHRIRGYGLPETLLEEALSVCRQLKAAASRLSFDIIDLHQKLLRRGIGLGAPESV